MTKKMKAEILEQKPAKPKKRRLTKAEGEEYARLMNEAWAGISKSIKEGKIQAPWWRREE